MIKILSVDSSGEAAAGQIEANLARQSSPVFRHPLVRRRRISPRRCRVFVTAFIEAHLQLRDVIRAEKASEPGISDSPMCNCTSEVHAKPRVPE